ncbi:MAG: H-NS family nucleoid-associated regulatory protein [Primorskyibacter sp.]
MSIDVNALSKKELQKLQSDVEKALRTIDDREKLAARKAVEDAAREHGFALSELLAEPSKTKGVAKYANPADLSQTWTGRGRKPNWVLAALEAGKSLDDLEI